MRIAVLLLTAALGASGCTGAKQPTPTQSPHANGANSADPSASQASDEVFDPAEFLPASASTAEASDPLQNARAGTIAITGGTVLTAVGQRYEPGLVMLAGGQIRFVGPVGGVEVPSGATVIDASGQFVTPGIIDSHSHLGVYPSPGVRSNADGNEIGSPFTAGVRAEYGYWPQDPGIPRAIAGGVTTALILPGSANLVGGRGFTVVMRPGRTAQEVRFPGAPSTVKMACGENPKRVYGDKGGPFTRMGEYTMFRERFRQAAEYALQWRAYEHRRKGFFERRARHKAQAESGASTNQAGAGNRKSGGSGSMGDSNAAPTPPAKNHLLDTLADILTGQALVQIHCYRADDIRQMIEIAEEFNFSIRSFHHALEAYKVRDLLVERDIAINTWADWWGFKMEAFDGIPENAALFAESGGRSVIHSDSDIGIQRLNQEAAKAMWAGRYAGIDISENQALRWITANAAWVLGIEEVTGTLEAGKRADVVIWSHSPFSVYSKAETVIQAGEVVYRRTRGRVLTDFELGNSAPVPMPRSGQTQAQGAGAR